MKTIIAKLDQEIIELEKDTNRGITPYNTLLIELTKKYAEVKQEYVKLDTSYKLDHIKAKRAKEAALIAEGAKRITDSELERYADAELMADYQARKDKFGEREYLEPIVTTYVNRGNGYKFDSKTDTKISGFINGATDV